MCILFIYRGVYSRGYRLILASNRDELYDRPAVAAGPWDEDETIVGGRDMEIGKEGGSWLAASPERYRIACLLNLTGLGPKDGAGRGNLVPNFVKGTMTSNEYFKDVMSSKLRYNYFNLVTVEIGSKDSSVSVFTNYNNEVYHVDDAFVGISNSVKQRPFKKVQEGEKQFAEIVNEFDDKTLQDELIKKLLDFLKSEEKQLPDEELEKRAPEWAEELSSIYVKKVASRYGTRTHTIILVDHEGNFQLFEKTMTAPINAEEPQWKATHIVRKVPL